MAEMTRRESTGLPWRRWLPLAVLLLGLALFLAFDLERFFTFRALADNREWLLAAVAQHPVLAPVAFVALYTALTSLSVPGALILTLAGGFLFGTIAGTIVTLIAATMGATIVFLVARTSFGEPLRRRAGPLMRRVEDGFRANAVSYLLVLRLVPLFPFWLVNLVPALLGVSLRTFILCSFFGMLPGTLIYSSVGAGLGAIIEKGETPDLHIVLQPRVLLPLIALALLSLLPIAYKRLSRRV
jgi:uncharacterized membrane protein YdjX (TVP38/TMEM64 family)